MKLLVENKLTEDGTYSESKDLWYRGSSRSNPLNIDDGNSYNEVEQYGPGIYFTNRYETAQGYGTVGLYRIPVKNFYKSKDKIDIKKIQEVIEYCNAEDLEMVLSNFDEDYIEKPQIALKKLITAIKNNCKDMPDALSQVALDVFRGDVNEFLMCCRAANIDGVIIASPNYAYHEENYLILYNPKIAKVIDSDITI